MSNEYYGYGLIGVVMLLQERKTATRGGLVNVREVRE
jgi:hypothetical protein